MGNVCSLARLMLVLTSLPGRLHEGSRTSSANISNISPGQNAINPLLAGNGFSKPAILLEPNGIDTQPRV